MARTVTKCSAAWWNSSRGEGQSDMPNLIQIITATEPDLRNQPLEVACAGLSLEELLEECAALDAFRRRSENLYERVRALFFLFAIHRFHLPVRLEAASRIDRKSVV